MLIEVKNYTKNLQGARVLDGVNATFQSGEICGLQGRNGSGKTMLLRAICGLIKPTSGCVSVDGIVIGKDIPHPGSVGLLLESPAFIDKYSGLSNLMMLANIRRTIGIAEVAQAMRDVGLDPEMRKPFKKYSLGMKQRLGIACAVMERPDIVLLDEPTNALDEAGIKLSAEIVRRERERGAIVVVASHDADYLESLADRIYEMADGKIVNERLGAAACKSEARHEVLS